MNGWRHAEVVLLLLAAVLLTATFAHPRVQLERPTFRYVFVFDITQSMNVQDVPAPNSAMTRLEYAKKTALEALTDMPCGTEIGLALFSGHRAFLLITSIEMCANYRELSTMLGGIDWRMTWEARSEVAKGVFKSIELLRGFEEQTRLVFLTDGHEAPPINPEVPPQFAGERGRVRGLLVGIGGDQLVAIPKFDKTGARQGYWKAEEVMQVDTFHAERNEREGRPASSPGSEHLSALRETYLQSLAAKTGLTYLRLVDTAALSRHLQSTAMAIPKVITTDARGVGGMGALLALMAARLRSPWRRLARHARRTAV